MYSQHLFVLAFVGRFFVSCGWRKIFPQKQVQKDAESTFYKKGEFL